MNPQQARALVTETFSRAFDKECFRNFVVNLLHHTDDSKAQAWDTTSVKVAFKNHVEDYERLSTYTSPEKERLDVLVVRLTTAFTLERARTAIRNFVADYLKTRDNKDAALVAFVSPMEKQWRFSYVKMEYAAVERDDGTVGVQTTLTPARRSSYIVGEGESCHTAQSRFLDLLQDTEHNPTLARIEDAFSVEAVTREFFGQYKALFLDLKDTLDDLANKETTIGAEFAAKKVSTTDFAKKLMGQVVFLYFLQKKGWLGVPKGRDWGDGPHNFLRQLFEGQFSSYENFFNDILESLFYDTLAADRGHEATCRILDCRIPFLDGGLFEPQGDYDWRRTDVIIPNELFSNSETTKGGDTGTGILDVFDRYNFTVNEAEPLEKEVAVDPEMLGKVFENLLEVSERKSKGSFYTPREIVHYMCQETLVNYLDVAVNAPTDATGTEQRAERDELVSYDDIETFVHSGDEASYYEAARLEGTKYQRRLPKAIEASAHLLDDKLADIAVCDPACGSGAFPVGMMQEIVRARAALTPYFNDVHDRSHYHFKRHAIQNCLYGVDIDPGAVDIAKLRLWLSLVVDEEDVKQIKPLPNLDFKIVTGNSLVGFPFTSERLGELEKLKARYFEEVEHERKTALKEEIDRALAECFSSSKRSLGYEVEFDFKVHFSEVFHAKGGFDAVIANPPYIDSETMTKKSPQLRKLIASSYSLTKGNWDIYIAFYEKAFGLWGRHGVVSFITPDKWISKPFGDQLRSKTTDNVFSILKAGREVFESATVDAIVTIFVNRQEPLLRVYTYAGTQVTLKRTVSKDTLAPPYAYDWLFSDCGELLGKVETHSGRLSDYGLCENACATSDAYKLKEFVEEEPEDATQSEYLRIINTGTIGKFVSKWGRREMVYLGDKYLRPVVHKKRFLAAFPNSYGKKAIKPKLIFKGLNLLDGCLDLEGTTIPGKTTLLVTSSKMETLKFIAAILNSSLAVFYLKERYPASSYNLGTTFTKAMINGFPIPEFRANDRAALVSCVDRSCVAKRRDAKADTSGIEREIDQLVYANYGLTEKEIDLVEGVA